MERSLSTIYPITKDKSNIKAFTVENSIFIKNTPGFLSKIKDIYFDNQYF